MASVARIGDIEVNHCSPMVRGSGSPNVFCNGRPISRRGDRNTAHAYPAGKGCSVHSIALRGASSTVKINGIGCGRIGDPTCTCVARGSSNVFVGG